MQKRTFNIPGSAVFESSLKSIGQLGWKLVSQNKAAGILQSPNKGKEKTLPLRAEEPKMLGRGMM